MPKLFWPTVRKNCSSDLKRFSQPVEHFFLKVGQNNFGYKIPVSFSVYALPANNFIIFLNWKFSVKNYRWKWHRGTSSDAKLQSPTPLPLRSSHPFQNHGGLFRPLHQRISPGLNVSFSVSQISTESMLFTSLQFDKVLTLNFLWFLQVLAVESKVYATSL